MKKTFSNYHNCRNFATQIEIIKIKNLQFYMKFFKVFLRYVEYKVAALLRMILLQNFVMKYY